MTIRDLAARLLGTTPRSPRYAGRQVHPPASRARPQQPDSRRLELHARLVALSEVHDAYHFDGYTTEEQFDLYLHRQITEVRQQLGLANPPEAAP